MILPPQQNKKKANEQLWDASMWIDGTEKKIKRLWFYTENMREYAIRNPTKCQGLCKAYIKLHDKMQHSTKKAKENPEHTCSIWCYESSALPKS